LVLLEGDFFVPLDCLFTMAEKAVICSYASWIQAFVLDHLPFFPPTFVINENWFLETNEEDATSISPSIFILMASNGL